MDSKIINILNNNSFIDLSKLHDNRNDNYTQTTHLFYVANSIACVPILSKAIVNAALQFPQDKLDIASQKYQDMCNIIHCDPNPKEAYILSSLIILEENDKSGLIKIIEDTMDLPETEQFVNSYLTKHCNSFIHLSNFKKAFIFIAYYLDFLYGNPYEGELTYF